MPAIKSKSTKEDLSLDELSDDALNGVYDVIMREWNRGPRRVPRASARSPPSRVVTSSRC